MSWNLGAVALVTGLSICGCGGDAGEAAAGGAAGEGGMTSNGEGGTKSDAGDGGRSPHSELCLVSATCTDGVVSGQFGVSCTPFNTLCELGCRQPPDPIQVPNAANVGDVALAAQYARDALCNGGEGGEGA